MKKLTDKLSEIYFWIDDIKKKNKVNDVYFRGHGYHKWELIPVLGRTENVKNYTENRLYYDFVQYGGHLIPAYKNTWEVLFLMQHHGIPTRLLDWTENFSVALYFALKNSTKGKSAAIWILDPYCLNKNAIDRDRIPYLDVSYPEGYTSYFINDAHKNYGKFPATVAAIGINPPNRRIVAQKGAFTIHRDIINPLETAYPDCLKKITIEPELIDDFKKYIVLTGITEFSLFPDLDGLSRFIKTLELTQ
ncbi:MAG: FRG domain-containing protein [Bacteroidetes bacterium]|nr:FRG domain-containing protein [Bacteroidota bacterium]